MKEELVTVWLADRVTSELIYLFLDCCCLQPFMFGAPPSNPTPTPEETMEADGNNSSGNPFAAPGKLPLCLRTLLLLSNTS